ncbi:MAG: dicarboxylate/amino acid:cation symporter [Treponema sp.]|nr:dicarboxylate/amino acid:cation symporter [Treponema sp.]
MKSSFLKHPATVLFAVAIGVLIGLFNIPISRATGIADFASFIAIPGQLYLFYLQMTVIPIIIAAISSNLGRLMRNKGGSGLIRRIVFVFIACIVVVALVGVIFGIFGRPGAGLDNHTRSLLSKLISTSDTEGISGVLELSLGTAEDVVNTTPQPNLGNFFRDLIPANIFMALASGSTMAIVFFSIIFGIAIGFLKNESASMLISLLTAVFEAFQKLISWSLYLLPFGLICLMAGQIAKVGPQIFMAMSKFITLYGIGTGLIFLIATAVIWIRSGIANPFRVLSILFEPVLLAFATRNSMATLPSAITCLDKKLGFDSTAVNLTLPLGMTLGRFGNIFYFGLAVFFVVQIYGMALGFMHYVIIFLGVVFAGTATAGASGIVTLSVISIILGPLNLPGEAVLVIFMAIDPIIDPFRTFIIVYINMAAATLIAKRNQGNEPAVEEEQTENDKNQLLVYIQEPHDRKPLLYRRDGVLMGLEIELLNKIAADLHKKIRIMDTAVLGYEEGAGIKRKADIIAGAVTRSEDAPLGFSFSRAWATITENNVKKPVCFLYPSGSSNAVHINGIIGSLNADNFIRRRVKGAAT